MTAEARGVPGRLVELVGLVELGPGAGRDGRAGRQEPSLTEDLLLSGARMCETLTPGTSPPDPTTFEQARQQAPGRDAGGKFIEISSLEWQPAGSRALVLAGCCMGRGRVTVTPQSPLSSYPEPLPGTGSARCRRPKGTAGLQRPPSHARDSEPGHRVGQAGATGAGLTAVTMGRQRRAQGPTKHRL